MFRKFAGPAIVVVFAALLGCASDSSSSGVSPTDSLIMIGVELTRMDPNGSASNQGEMLVALSLREVTTGQVHHIELTGEDHAVAVLPAGIYCLNELNPYDTMTLTYCREPFFQLKPGEVENAGYFVFSIDFRNQKFKLNNSFLDMKGLESSLNLREKNLIEKFRKSHETAAPAVATAGP
jgi:hypothetical protein